MMVREQSQNVHNDSSIDVDDVKSLKENETYQEEKKFTPIYNDIDESVKTYYEFREYLTNLNLDSNYELVLFKELLEYGKSHKGEIAESLAYFNNKDTTDIDVVTSFFNVLSFDDLQNDGFIIECGTEYGLLYYTINVQLTELQRIEFIHSLTARIIKYNQEQDIPENIHPHANNMNNINWDDYDFEKESSVIKTENSVNNVSSTSRKVWIWSITPANWKIVKSKHVWGSILPKEKIGSRVHSGDQVAFYIVGPDTFQGIFEFVGDWYDSTESLWDVDDVESDDSLKYHSRIDLMPVQLGTATIFELCDEMELFITKSQSIYSSIFEDCNGYPSNYNEPLLEEDFEIIKKYLAKNPLTDEPSVKQINSKNVKECLKCHTRVEESSDFIFEYLVEEIFGYEQSDSNDPQTKKLQSYCRGCTSLDLVSQITPMSENTVKNETVPTISHICSICNETKVEGVPGIKLDENMDKFFGFKSSHLTNIPDSRKPNTVCKICSNKTNQEINSEIKSEMFIQVKDTQPVTSLDIPDIQIFDSVGDTLNIKNYEISSTNTIQKNQILSNDDLISIFKVGNMGGIRYTKKNNIIVLLSTYSNNYDNLIDVNSGLIEYTGEGNGNQEMKNGNKKILNSQNTQIVFFKEVFQKPGSRLRGALDNKYQFIGIVKYKEHQFKKEKERQVIKFILEIQS